MKLDRQRAEDCAHTAIIFKEVDAFGRDGRMVNLLCSIHVVAGRYVYQTQLAKVIKISEGLAWVIDFCNRARLPRVHLPQVLKNFFLKSSIDFHMSGLRDQRFEWNQNGITDAPGTNYQHA